MPLSFTPSFTNAAAGAAPKAEGAAVVFWRASEEGAPALSGVAKAADDASEGQVARALAAAKSPTDAIALRAPHGLEVGVLILIGLGAQEPTAIQARALGGKTAKALIGAGAVKARAYVDGFTPEAAAELAMGLSLRAYRFDLHKAATLEKETLAEVEIAAPKSKPIETAFAKCAALAEGVATTRDLVNEPANFLTPPVFAERIAELAEIGLKIEILGEKELEKLGMRALLAVGRGSRKESHVAIMRWSGARSAKAAPLCLVGKGVCFDTGGISLKPAGGMEEMTMDMGGAGAVVGAMKTLALRKAKANVVGIVGLVENMPDGDAQRPGDIVTAADGQTIEVINTDAEGRLVLADLLWYAQEHLKPCAMVDLATLTGAMLVALGHDYAGYFANDDAFSDKIAAAAKAENEAVWRMPLGPCYDKLIKSRLADMKNAAGRYAGSITAAQFLQRFVDNDMPWAHIDVAGVTLPKEPGDLWPKGPSGWGVATLARLAEDMFNKPKA